MPSAKKKSRIIKKPTKTAKNTPQNETTPIPTRSANRGLSSPQLTILLCISIATSYIFEYGHTVTAGLSSQTCATYFLDTESCTESDLFFIRAKYHSSILSLVFVSICALFCWNEPPLLQRLNTMLCLSPLSATFLGLVLAKDSINEKQRFRIALMSLVLFTVSYSSNNVGLAPFRRTRFTSFHDCCIVAFVVVNIGMVVYRHFWMGPETYSMFEDITNGSTTLFKFMAVDRLTNVLLVVFGLFFLDEVRKRAVLLIFAIAHLGELYYQLPLQAEFLRDVDNRYNTLLGSAIYLGILTVLPSRNRK